MTELVQIMICKICGVAHSDKVSCPCCELLEFFMEVEIKEDKLCVVASPIPEKNCPTCDRVFLSLAEHCSVECEIATETE